ncbi:MAG: ankyrin repeat domain-containing protein [Vicinamibacterales bacterium]|nr:ankyrin repeat domain-containing protein [Vicinamibacterales bacterium]
MTVSLRFISATVVLAIVGLGAGARDLRVADAAERRDGKAVRVLLKQGVDAKATQPDGATALHWAAHWNDVALAKDLVAAKTDPNAANDYGVTPLFLAVTNGSLEMTEVLLGAGARAGAALPTGETVLMTAVRGGNPAVVKRLIGAGADPNAAQKSKGQTALMWAATSKNVPVASVLIEGGARAGMTTANGFTALLFAAKEGSIEMARLLLASGAKVDEQAKDGSTPILAATVRGHSDLAMFLLDQGAKPDGALAVAGYSPLHFAAARFDDALAPVELNQTGEWRALLGMPDRKGKLALINALLARGADVNAMSTKPLLRAGFGESFFGSTPFIIATGSGDVEVMKLLLAKGADPKATGDSGRTAIIAACDGNADTSVVVTEADRMEAIKVALEAGVSIEAADAKGYRAMHSAATNGFHKIIKLLLDKGADLNPVTNSRNEKDYGTGVLVVAGQSPLGIVEGTFTGGVIRERPDTAAFLRTLGAKSVGKATLDTYLKAFENQQKGAAGNSSKPAAAGQ